MNGSPTKRSASQTATLRPANAPASRNLGDEIDFIATIALNTRTSLLFGYSHFFAGDYYEETPGVPFRRDADFLYTQFQINF